MEEDWRPKVEAHRPQIVRKIKQMLEKLAAPGDDFAARETKLNHIAAQFETMQWRDASTRHDYRERITKKLKELEAQVPAHTWARISAAVEAGMQELRSRRRMVQDAPGNNVGDFGKEGLLAALPSELLLQVAETLGNPLALLVSKAHLSKAVCEAARAAQATLEHADLREWSRKLVLEVEAVNWWRSSTVDDAAVIAVVSKCKQLSSLNLENCDNITDAAVMGRWRWPWGAPS